MTQPNGVGALESPFEFAQRLSLPFNNDLRLLTRALTHTSYLNENDNVADDNERLEFLGDAVLDFVVGAWLYEHCPEMREGELTRMRSALVRTESLAGFARQINLGGALMLGKGERHNGGADRDTLLCAGFEALIGALYLQASLPAVQRFMQPFLNASQEQVLTGTNVYDAKSKLQEWTQAQKMGIPHYVVTAERGPDHAKTFVVEAHIDGKVYGTGSGQSKSAAAQAAAKATLDMLGID